MADASPNFAEFKRLAGRGNVVPVYRTILADLLSPVSAFLGVAPQHGRAANSPSHSFLLESVEGGERVGRYTFFGVDPFQIVSCRGSEITLERGSERATESGNIFERLRQIGAAYHPVEVEAGMGEAL